MSLSEVDRQLLQRCLDGAPRAWQDFVDRFLGLVVHVANHTAQTRGKTIDSATRDDLVADVFVALLKNDMSTLRRFRRNCSLATYLTVISRRVIVRRLMANQRNGHRPLKNVDHTPDVSGTTRLNNEQEVADLMLRLDPQEASVVRMFHLEGKTYQEISRVVGIHENSIGSMLSRARAKMRQAGEMN